MREAGIVMSQAVLIAVGIDWDGRHACRNCDGSTTGAISPRPRPISPHGFPNGRPATHD
uniref:hypothetical protein n=1 Tax=Mesorhizobium caraganae TaxID=483206 RepID=UPI0035E3D30B